MMEWDSEVLNRLRYYLSLNSLPLHYMKHCFSDLRCPVTVTTSELEPCFKLGGDSLLPAADIKIRK